jgi:aspartate aminotransferase
MIGISKMASLVQPSATLAAGAKARQMRAEGVEVFDFSLGEPDFTTPQHIREAAYAAMNRGETHYTPVNGTLALRSAICRYYEQQHGLRYHPDQALVSNGAKHSLHNALAATVGPGDEVIIPTPYWVSYSDLVAMTGASYVLVPTTPESGFKMTASQLRAAVTPRSKLLMLNSPSNPTGAVYSREEQQALADVVLECGLGVISDEIYEHLVYDGARAVGFATVRPGLADRVITISGVSKTYAMTGWRIGWSVGPANVIRAMGNVQSQETSCPSSVSQAAALAALEGSQACVEEMRREMEHRRGLVMERLRTMRGIQAATPAGAFYAFFDITAHYGRLLGGVTVTSSVTFCQAALEGAKVNLVPGTAFGAEGLVRMSYAASRDQIAQGLDRLAKLLA